jgi:hypothetical protein
MVSSATATTVSLVPIEEGQPGSSTNPLQPSDTITIKVTTDAGLFALDAVLTITSGSGWITDAMWPCLIGICPWDPIEISSPIIDPDGQSAEIGAVTFGAPPSGVVGWFEIRCDGPGQLVVDLTNGISFGGSADTSFMTPTFDGTLTIYQVPEPVTFALLGLGALALMRRRK